MRFFAVPDACHCAATIHSASQVCGWLDALLPQFLSGARPNRPSPVLRLHGCICSYLGHPGPQQLPSPLLCRFYDGSCNDGDLVQ